MTEEEYLNSMEDDSPVKDIVDAAFDGLFDVFDNDGLDDILEDMGYNVSIINAECDLDGVEVPIPYINIVYDSDQDINEKQLKKKLIEIAQQNIE